MRRIAIREIGSHYGKICKSAGGTNEHVRLYGVGRMLEYEQVERCGDERERGKK